LDNAARPGLRPSGAIGVKENMPKRSNDFQKMILRIYSQMKSTDSTVEESVLLVEKNTDEKREIDILISINSFNSVMRIAIECRGRKKKDDIQWIDELVGKYRDLDVNKVVAVSKSGFSKGAIEKAKQNNIDTLTLKEAETIDWPNHFVRLGIAKVNRFDRPDKIIVQTEPAISIAIQPSTEILLGDGSIVGTIVNLAKSIYSQELENINRSIGEKMLIDLYTIQEIKDKTITIQMEKRNPNPNIFIFVNDVTKARIISITVIMKASFTFESIEPKHYLLGNAQVTVATINEDKNSFSIMAVQEKDKPNEIRVNTDQSNYFDTNIIKIIDQD
jgi:hypothetical protein